MNNFRFGNGKYKRFSDFFYGCFKLKIKFILSGGVVEWVPCSHVAHIYRGPRTESVHPPGGNPHQSSIVS